MFRGLMYLFRELPRREKMRSRYPALLKKLTQDKMFSGKWGWLESCAPHWTYGYELGTG